MIGCQQVINECENDGDRTSPKCDTKLRFTVKSDSYGDVGGGAISSSCCWVAWKFDRDETGENGCFISVGRKFVPAASR